MQHLCRLHQVVPPLQRPSQCLVGVLGVAELLLNLFQASKRPLKLLLVHFLVATMIHRRRDVSTERQQYCLIFFREPSVMFIDQLNDTNNVSTTRLIIRPGPQYRSTEYGARLVACFAVDCWVEPRITVGIGNVDQFTACRDMPCHTGTDWDTNRVGTMRHHRPQ